jgi:hypothetical protein
MRNTNVIYHTVRDASGRWQNYFGLVESAVSGGPLGFAAVGCAGTGDALQVVGVGTDGQLYHAIRNPDGSWQKSFGSVASEVSGGPGEFMEVACGGVGGDLHVVATGSDQQIYHTIRDASGHWQDTFGLIESQVSGGPRVFETVSCASVGTELQVAGAAGSIYHTIRDASGHWQTPFGLIESGVSGGPAEGFRGVGCAGAGEILEVVGVGSHGELYHTIRNPDGSWQNFFGLIESRVCGGPAKGFGRADCAGVGDVLEIAGLGSDGQLYHTIRNPDGSWQNFFGLIEAQVTGGPLQFTAVSCARVGADLHIVGGAFLSG